MGFELPVHLRKYIVRQEDRTYTPVDHAVWRYCLRQLRAYLSKHAHEAYLEGLTKTGIEIERIPRIQDISEKISKFGWRALPVSGFIPPAAFMELQALNVLPIASDIRTLDHILYTPAPDIVHEAAGHAPMLAHPEYAEYLRQYAQVAKMALISKEDMDLYEAIRDLSDVKENPQSTQQEIQAAEERLNQAVASQTHVSEATWLSRMNWWTAEYGLIGTLDNPRIYGAGLLSSVGESKLCLSPKVKKLPLTIDCINYTYDITEPQPQLFVTPDFQTLTKVLDELADLMAFRRGGLESVERAIQARTVNTVQLNSGLQISGRCVEAISANNVALAYLRFEGPSQLAVEDKEIPGHGKDYHAHGFGTALGFLKDKAGRCLSELSDSEWENLGAKAGGKVHLRYESGVEVAGDFVSRFTHKGRSLILTLKNAKATLGDRVLFDPSWGTFDLALGSSVPSVYGGPADRLAFGEMDDFVAKKVPAPVFSEKEKERHRLYDRVSEWRRKNEGGPMLEKALRETMEEASKDYAEDWLLFLELYELSLHHFPTANLTKELYEFLKQLADRDPSKSQVIHEGLALAVQLN